MSFYLFRRYFFSSRSGSLIRIVSWVCLAGMTVSVAALIIIVSVMGGFGKAIKSRLLSKEAHLLIHFENTPFIKTKLPDSKKQSPPNTKQSLFFDREEPPIIFSQLTKKQSEGIKNALVFETQNLILKSSEGFKGVSTIGYSKKQWDKQIEQIFYEGTTPKNPLPLKPDQTKEVLLSYGLALETGLTTGDNLNLIPMAGLLLPPNLLPPVKKFKVKGILQNTTATQASSIYYKQGYMDFGDFSKINYKAELQLKDPEQVALYQQAFKNHKTQTWIERNSSLFFALQLEKFIMTLFLTLALVISCLGISSALFLLISQKGEDLAILQAMGLSQKEIVKVFTGVGFSLALIGLFLGTFIGLSTVLFLKYNSWNLLSEMYQDRTIPAIFMPINYLIILLCALLLSWISCYLPTKYLSKIKPAELLKTTY